MKKKWIVLNAAHCLLCGDSIVSRHVHDYVECKCGNVFVDGGTEYFRYGGKDLSDKACILIRIIYDIYDLNQLDMWIDDGGKGASFSDLIEKAIEIKKKRRFQPENFA